ncbi:unnamed protein product [Sphenostylis stenocarpa]|uniref:Uncharacterized protein n=1 Tax=Sphenostylis stenocarpa TaxID=92480 RepID=A0AA86VW19_9FABA|nr:unnamed protein product [Sphenostylis stenocarpa]
MSEGRTCLTRWLLPRVCVASYGPRVYYQAGPLRHMVPAHSRVLRCLVEEKRNWRIRRVSFIAHFRKTSFSRFDSSTRRRSFGLLMSSAIAHSIPQCHRFDPTEHHVVL